MQLNPAVILLQGAPTSPLGGNWTPVFFGLMFVVMYFFMIRPQQKRAKDQKKFADSMVSGEQIVTSAGIHGRIDRANDDGTLKIEISRNTFMTIDRSAVSMEMTVAARKKLETSTGVSATPATAK